jgi:hypothetical protein
MPTRQPRLAAVLACAAVTAALAGCGSSGSGPAVPTIAPARTFSLTGFEPSAPVRAGVPTRVAFTIRQPSGRPLTRFQRGSGPHTGVHVILVRADLAEIVHRHPAITAGGLIADTIVFPAPGRYRLVADVYPGGGRRNFQLFRTITVAGRYTPKAVPPFTRTVTTAGYRFTMRGRPALHAISPAFLTVTVRRPDGTPASPTPWFGALAHAIFFRAGTLDYFHTHVCGQGASGCTSSIGGTSVTGRSTTPGTLRIGVLVPVSGTWRLFVQCRVDGRVLTAPFTLAVS